MSWEIRVGDVLDELQKMPDESVQCCVTSPPYWGLRDYGTAEWEGGDPECDHMAPPTGGTSKGSGLVGTSNRGGFSADGQYRDTCAKCGAKRIDHQLGLEPTPEEYIANMVEVFREVRRVLRDDGTLWLNLGDSYAGSWGAQSRTGETSDRSGLSARQIEAHPKKASNTGSIPPGSGLKPKDLCGIPWRVALALQADSWWLRSDIIWAKPNPMPESVTDRPTKAHEYIFLLTKSERYFYDHDAVREPSARPDLVGNAKRNIGPATKTGGRDGNEVGNLRNDNDRTGVDYCHPDGRNRRTVWEITTRPFPEAHFAVFPPDIPEVCIKAGTSEKGACPECGAPWERVVERERLKTSDLPRHSGNTDRNDSEDGGLVSIKKSESWQPTCECDSEDTEPCTVLDPFSGAGTTGVVALRLRRSYIGIELNPEYAEMSRRRIDGDAPLFNRNYEDDAA